MCMASLAAVMVPVKSIISSSWAQPEPKNSSSVPMTSWFFMRMRRWPARWSKVT